MIENDRPVFLTERFPRGKWQTPGLEELDSVVFPLKISQLEVYTDQTFLDVIDDHSFIGNLINISIWISPIKTQINWQNYWKSVNVSLQLI